MTGRNALSGHHRWAGSVGAVRVVSELTVGRLARFLLLVGTLIGLAAMHSLGHHTSLRMANVADHDSPATAAHTHAHVLMASEQGSPVEMTGAVPALAAPVAEVFGVRWCGADDCVRLGPAPDQQHRDDGVGWMACMAVVTVFGLVLALGAALLGQRAGRWSDLPLLARVAGSRGPPARTVGLVLASTSVLRT